MCVCVCVCVVLKYKYNGIVVNIPDYVRVSLGCGQLKGRGPGCIPLVNVEIFCRLSQSHDGCGGGGLGELMGVATPRMAKV